MRNVWIVWGLRCLPMVFLFVFMFLQYSYLQGILRINREFSDKQYENLDKRMREDNLPPEVQRAVTQAVRGASSNTQMLVASLSSMQITVQTLLFIVFYSFYLMTLNIKLKKEAVEPDR